MDAEGVIKFKLEHAAGALPDLALEPCGVLIAWRRILMELGLMGRDPQRYGGAGFGNLSARVPPLPGERGQRRFVVTGTQTTLRRDIGLHEFCLIEAYDAKRNWVRSVGPIQPSSETMTHGTLYDLNPAIRFIFHTHTPVIWRHAKVLHIPTTDPSALYGTPEMAADVARLHRSTALAEIGILSMGGHEDGVISFGRTAEQAGLAHLTYLARAYLCEQMDGPGEDEVS